MRKMCSKCRKIKDEKNFHRNSFSSDGRHSYCKECRNPQARASQRRYARKQSPVVPQPCEICGIANHHRRNNRDHDHASKKPRGSLCLCCNMGLGHFRDSVELLTSAIAYLNRYSQLNL